jgi:hypothetical protein
MKTKPTLVGLLLAGFCALVAIAQDKPADKQQAAATRPETASRHEPPPQAYTDCKGKKAGDAIQHSTPQGNVAATCEDSPKGLVARPNQKKGLTTK